MYRDGAPRLLAGNEMPAPVATDGLRAGYPDDVGIACSFNAVPVAVHLGAASGPGCRSRLRAAGKVS